MLQNTGGIIYAADSADLFTPETQDITDTDPLLHRHEQSNNDGEGGGDEPSENIVDSTLKRVEREVIKRVVRE